jgi:hypothetical protein
MKHFKPRDFSKLIAIPVPSIYLIIIQLRHMLYFPFPTGEYIKQRHQSDWLAPIRHPPPIKCPWTPSWWKKTSTSAAMKRKILLMDLPGKFNFHSSIPKRFKAIFNISV